MERHLFIYDLNFKYPQKQKTRQYYFKIVINYI